MKVNKASSSDTQNNRHSEVQKQALFWIAYKHSIQEAKNYRIKEFLKNNKSEFQKRLKAILKDI